MKEWLVIDTVGIYYESFDTENEAKDYYNRFNCKSGLTIIHIDQWIDQDGKHYFKSMR